MLWLLHPRIDSSCSVAISSVALSANRSLDPAALCFRVAAGLGMSASHRTDRRGWASPTSRSPSPCSQTERTFLFGQRGRIRQDLRAGSSAAASASSSVFHPAPLTPDERLAWEGASRRTQVDDRFWQWVLKHDIDPAKLRNDIVTHSDSETRALVQSLRDRVRQRGPLAETHGLQAEIAALESEITKVSAWEMHRYYELDDPAGGLRDPRRYDLNFWYVRFIRNRLREHLDQTRAKYSLMLAAGVMQLAEGM